MKVNPLDLIKGAFNSNPKTATGLTALGAATQVLNPDSNNGTGYNQIPNYGERAPAFNLAEVLAPNTTGSQANSGASPSRGADRQKTTNALKLGNNTTNQVQSRAVQKGTHALKIGNRTTDQVQSSTTTLKYVGEPVRKLPPITITETNDTAFRKVYDSMNVVSFSSGLVHTKVAELQASNGNPAVIDELRKLGGTGDGTRVFTNRLSAEAAAVLGFDLKSKEDVVAYNQTTPEGRLASAEQANMKAVTELAAATEQMKNALRDQKYPSYNKAKEDYMRANAAGNKILADHALNYIQAADADIASQAEVAKMQLPQFAAEAETKATLARATKFYDLNFVKTVDRTTSTDGTSAQDNSTIELAQTAANRIYNTVSKFRQDTNQANFQASSKLTDLAASGAKLTTAQQNRLQATQNLVPLILQSSSSFSKYANDQGSLDIDAVVTSLTAKTPESSNLLNAVLTMPNRGAVFGAEAAAIVDEGSGQFVADTIARHNPELKEWLTSTTNASPVAKTLLDSYTLTRIDDSNISRKNKIARTSSSELNARSYGLFLATRNSKFRDLAKVILAPTGAKEPQLNQLIGDIALGKPISSDILSKNKDVVVRIREEATVIYDELAKLGTSRAAGQAMLMRVFGVVPVSSGGF